MLTIQQTMPLEIQTIPSYFSIEDTLFFDIETTGLSPKISNLYLIGCLYVKDKTLHLIQWFADDYHSEELILREFFKLLESFKLLAHYNGSGFDIPYLQNKCEKYHLSYTFGGINSLDIYKKITGLKPILALPNLKQKTIESFLGLSRKDPYDGKELISIYSDYMQNKILSKPFETQLDSLLLHNKEDVFGLFHSIKMLSYLDLFDGTFSIEKTRLENNQFHIQLSLQQELPHSFTFKNETFFLSANEKIANITISILKDSLKFFYDNYKEYYYLPEEDTAIHKSVATYVDKKYRQKAKANNCYIRKSGLFLPEYKKTITPAFKKDYHAKIYYFELTENIQSNYSLIKNYLLDLFQTL